MNGVVLKLYVINAPCKTGDMIWFINSWGSVSWGKVVAFTETHIIAWSSFTEYKSFKEFLPISEWNISIVKSEDRKEAEDVIFNNVLKGDESYSINKGFKRTILGK